MSTTLYIKTLSPVFIGSGSHMEPFEYYYDQTNKTLYRLEVDKAFDLLVDRYPQAPEKFSAWIDRVTQQLDDERDNKKQSELRSKFSIPEFVRTELKDQRLSQELLNDIRNARVTVYSIVCPSLTGMKREIRKRATNEDQQRKKTIAVALKTATNELYLPGSSLKGSIRTALLHACISEADPETLTRVKGVIEKSLKSQQQSKKENWAKQFADKLEHDFFKCGYVQNDRPAVYDDAKYDLMKLISITDSNAKPTNDAGSVVPVDVYQANGAVQPQTPAVEAIAAGQVFQVRLTVDIGFILRAKELIDRNDPYFGKKVWIGFKEKFERLFHVNWHEITPANEAMLEQRIVTRILDACRLHGEAIARRDIEWATTSRREDIVQLLRSFDGASHIRLGYASSFLGTTVFLAMIEHQSLKPLMQEVLKTLGIGKPPRARNPRPPDLDRFPTSRRLQTVLEQTQSANPLGWIALSTQPLQPGVSQFSRSRREQPETPKGKPPGTVLAEIIDASVKPPRVRILEGDHNGKETIMPGIHLQNLGLTNGSQVYVQLQVQKGKLIKADYRQKAQ